MNMNRFFAWPMLATLVRMMEPGLGAHRVPSPRELPDHILKDIGLSRSEILSVTSFARHDPTRRQRA
jgi:hypothetical protein